MHSHRTGSMHGEHNSSRSSVFSINHTKLYVVVHSSGYPKAAVITVYFIILVICFVGKSCFLLLPTWEKSRKSGEIRILNFSLLKGKFGGYRPNVCILPRALTTSFVSFFLPGNLAVVLTTIFYRRKMQLVTAKFCILNLAIADQTVGLFCVCPKLVACLLETYAKEFHTACTVRLVIVRSDNF